MEAAPERVADEVLDELRRRLRATRWVDLPRGVGWERGTDAGFLAELVDAWADSYDWRPHEDRIRALPWCSLAAPAGRAVHQRGARDPGTPAVVLLHGWPDSVLRFERLLPLLGDLDVVVPALPGFPFAPPLTEPGMSTTAMADAVAAWMAELGYDRYVVSGGDIGSSVAEALAAAHPERVAAVHLTEVTYRHLLAATAAPAGLDAEALAFLDELRRWQATEGAYAHEQATKPHSLAPALGDSPAGLAAWLVEKLRRWSDCDGDLEAVFARDDLLTWITAYWVGGTIGTSFSPYFEPDAPVGPVTAPTVVTIFPRDLLRAPRSLGERHFDIRRWDEPAAGGHFGAWEQPEAYAESLRAALALADEAAA